MFLSVLVHGQTADNFKDADLLTNPKWEGNLSKFTTENEYLRSNSILVNDAFYLSTSSTQALNGQWELLVSLNFSTSSKNLVRYHILSDSLNLLNSQNGYFIEIGGTKDKLSFVKINAGITTELFSSPDGSISGGNSSTRLKVIRDSGTTFHLYADYSGGVGFALVGSVRDTAVLLSKASGIEIEQSTSSFFQKHYFDDFYAGQIILDKTPPVLLQLSQVSLKTIRLLFDEDLDSISAVNISNYTGSNGIGGPSSIGLANKEEVELTFLTDFNNPGNYEVKISNVMDVAGNILDTTALFSSLVASSPLRHEILITELLPITDPPVYLPKGEFIELYNPTDIPMELSGMSIGDLSSKKGLPEYIMLKKEYLILCNMEDSLAYSIFGKVLVVLGLPSLNNSGDRIRLTNAQEEIIHEVEYASSIFPSEKSSGWSMEMVDSENPCNFIGNWKASKDRMGGTPGEMNSVKGVNVDEVAARISSVYPLGENKVEMTFNESIIDKSLLKDATFRILETGNVPDSILTTDNLSKFILCFSSAFQKGDKYSLEFSGGEDCAGNSIELDTIVFGLPLPIKEGNILINEVLYEPITGGEEFIELYNNTDLFLDLKGLKIAKKVDGSYEEVEFVSLVGHLIAPNSFVVLTKEAQGVLPFYSTKDSLVFFETLALPSFSNSGMEIVLLNVVNEEIDAVNYDPKWHYEVIAETKGVSLERISKTVSNNSFNWTSASSSSGFGTPGMENSQSREISKASSNISLESKSFSPNGDGYQDMLILNYKMSSPSTTANVYVFNENGALVKQIVNNETLSTTGILTWDGEREIGGKANVGIYILLFEYFTSDGKVEKKKISCALVL